MARYASLRQGEAQFFDVMRKQRTKSKNILRTATEAISKVSVFKNVGSDYRCCKPTDNWPAHIAIPQKS
jgi:hypothetical protein